MKNNLKRGDLVEIRVDIHPQMTLKTIGKIIRVFEKNKKTLYEIVDHKGKFVGNFTKEQIELR